MCGGGSSRALARSAARPSGMLEVDDGSSWTEYLGIFRSWASLFIHKSSLPTLAHPVRASDDFFIFLFFIFQKYIRNKLFFFADVSPVAISH